MKAVVTPRLALFLGAFACIMLALFGSRITTPGLIAPMAAQAPDAIAQAGGTARTQARFISPGGWPTRHPIVSGAEALSDQVRVQIAYALAAIPGVAGIRWSDGDLLAEADAPILSPMHCQEDVQGLLRARSIRFEESSARIDSASRALIDEVATALSPCLGAIIGISGHTDSSGSEVINLALSRERAIAIRDALVRRGIPAEGLRAEGLGSSQPVDGLAPADPANRRIEFTVLATEPIVPTPIDTPAAR